MQLAPPRSHVRVERPGGDGVEATPDPLALHPDCVRPVRGSERKHVSPGAVTENITASFSVFRFSKEPPSCVAGQIGANAGHLRDEQRRTGIGSRRPQPWHLPQSPRSMRRMIAVPAVEWSAHASPAVSVASNAVSPCGVSPLRVVFLASLGDPQRGPAKARQGRQAPLSGSTPPTAQASTSSSAGEDATGRSAPFAAPPATSRSGRTRRPVVDYARTAVTTTTRPITPTPARPRAQQRPHA